MGKMRIGRADSPTQISQVQPVSFPSVQEPEVKTIIEYIEIPKEIIVEKLVPYEVEVIKEIIIEKEIPVEVIKYETITEIKEIIKEIPVETIIEKETKIIDIERTLEQKRINIDLVRENKKLRYICIGLGIILALVLGVK